MDDYEEAFNEYYNFQTGTHRAVHAIGPESWIKEEKRFRRLIIEGIIVVDTTRRTPWPVFVPAGEPERIWRATKGQDPRWQVTCRRFIWEEGNGRPLKGEGLRKRFDWIQIMRGRIRQALRH